MPRNRSQVTILTLGTSDVEAPGAPGLSAQQNSNTTGSFTVTPPITDAGGSALSGLVGGEAVVIEARDFEAEAYRNNFDGAKRHNGAQVFSFAFDADELGGFSPVTQAFAIANPGSTYAILACVYDGDEDSGTDDADGDGSGDVQQ